MNKFEVLGVIGEGAYGIVLKCRNKETGQIVAIKKFKQFEDESVLQKTIVREVKLLDTLRHKNIVDLIKAFKRKGQIYLVFEYMERNVLELLDEHPRGLKPEIVKKLIYQLLLAIDCCHSHNVIHRDIKPENLLVNSDYTMKLCDFGFARQINNKCHTLTDYVATRWYRAPELLLGSTTYSYAVDMWAIGCIMGELITGEPLFPGESEIDQLYIIQKVIGRLTSSQMELFLRNPRFAGLRFPDLMKPETIEKKFIGKITRSALSFMEGVLQMNPEDRLTSNEALNHVYFKNLRNKDSGSNSNSNSGNNGIMSGEYNEYNNNNNRMMMMMNGNERSKRKSSSYNERKEDNNNSYSYGYGYSGVSGYNNNNSIRNKNKEYNPIYNNSTTINSTTTTTTSSSYNNNKNINSESKTNEIMINEERKTDAYNNNINKPKRVGMNKRKLSEIDSLKNEYKINEEKKLNELKPSYINTPPVINSSTAASTNSNVNPNTRSRCSSGMSNLSIGITVKNNNNNYSNRNNPILHNRAFNINNSPYQMMINMRPIKENSNSNYKSDFYRRNAEKREILSMNPIVGPSATTTTTTAANSNSAAAVSSNSYEYSTGNGGGGGGNMKRIYNESKINESIVGSGLPTIK